MLKPYLLAWCTSDVFQLLQFVDPFSGLTLAEDGTVQAIDDVTTKMEDVENGAGVEDQKELFVADEMMEEEKPKMQKEEYVDQNEYVSTSYLFPALCWLPSL